MTKRGLFTLITIGLLLAISSNCSREKGKQPERKAAQIQKEASTQLPARQIIDKMAHAYSSCKSYYDEGVVKAVFFRNRRRWTEELHFTTAFVRPGRFRFEFTRGFGKEGIWNRYIVWRDGKSVRTWWSIEPEIENPGSLSMELAGATGISRGSANKMPRLLLPDEIGGWSLTNLMEPELLEDEIVNGVPCFRIHGKDNLDDTNKLWIEKKSYLVRKIATQHSFPDLRTEITTTYNPRFNVDIQPDQLKFNLPVE
jgi:outer membrane lipoprotein-sorting protein